MPSTVHKLVELQEILKNEETQSYNEALRSAPHNCLSQMHSEAVYQKSLCRLLEYSCSALTLTLDASKKNMEFQLARLKEERRKLKNKLAAKQKR